MKKLPYLLGLSVLLFMTGCDKNDYKTDPTVTFTSTLNGSNEETATGSTATGTASATYNMNTKILDVTVNYTGLTPVAGHIHKGALKVSGPVIFPFTAPLTSPIYFTSPALDATQEADLLAGLYYVNLHTATFPNGEIRGQLVKN
jgi:hypothetical protein